MNGLTNFHNSKFKTNVFAHSLILETKISKNRKKKIYVLGRPHFLADIGKSSIKKFF